MADVLDALLHGECTPLDVVMWMKMETSQPSIPDVLVKLQSEKKEFIPYFLNYLRDQTIHLIQNTKSVSPSPSKSESNAPVITPERQSFRRTELFPNSDYCRNSGNYAKDFPELNTEKSPDCLVKGMKSSVTNTTVNTAENIMVLKRSKKVQNKKMAYPVDVTIENKETQMNCINGEIDTYSYSSCKTTNHKRRNWKVQNNDRRSSHSKNRAETPGHVRHQSCPTLWDQAVITFQPKVKPSRRIKPTPVQAGMVRKQNQAFIESPENTNESLRSEDNNHKELSSFQEERELLKLEKAKVLQAASNSWNATPASSLNHHSPTKNCNVELKEIIEASLSLVTDQQYLDTLIQTYSECLYAALFPSLTVEVFFLVQLLVAKSAEKDTMNLMPNGSYRHNYLSSIHNIVYFSVKVLQNLLPLLPLLGRTVLRLLCDNPRIGHFSLTLKNVLCQLQESDCRSLQMSPVPMHCSIGGVPFQAETDNRNNFPTPKTFSAFRAQRDHFYELIREWKDNHEKPQWSLKAMLYKKIHLVLSPDSELANYWHLAKLFVSQLIIMYHEDNNMSFDGDEDSISFLSQLRKSNPEKFKLLQERFIIPLSTNGPSPAPSFFNSQEFFHEFILLANSHIFNQHLCDILKSKISELDKSQFITIENVSEDGDVPKTVKKEFRSSILTLRLLAKFLGFITFLPYQSANQLPDELHSTYVNIRNENVPSCDIISHINEAYARGRLCLTIPWVVEFLSWVDKMSPLLDYYQEVIQLLLFIHRKTWSHIKPKLCLETHLFIIIQIEWLLGIPNMPEGVFFTYCEKSETNEIPDKCLDVMNVVDQSLLYTCCPYLGSIKTLLTDFAMGSSSKASTLRKITPIAADDSVGFSSRRQLQIQLEDNFFHNHPASLRKTVEFIAKRMVSNFIKLFRTRKLESLLQQSRSRFTQEAPEQSLDSTNIPGFNDEGIDNLCKDFMQDVQKYLKEEMRSYVEGNGKKVIEVLLVDYNEIIKIFSTKIIIRLAEEGIHQWIAANITKAFFINEMKHERNRILKNKAPIDKLPLPDTHNVIYQQPTEVLVEFKDFLRDMVLDGLKPDIEKIKNSLQDAQNMISNRQDLSVGVVKTLKDITLYMAIEIIINYPDEWVEVKEMFFDFWLNNVQEKNSEIVLEYNKLERLLQKSPNKQLSRSHLESLNAAIFGLSLATSTAEKSPKETKENL
ncbi:Hypothetical predicted protein [Argonauta hians]